MRKTLTWLVLLCAFAAFAAQEDVVTATATQTLTNKTISGGTITGITDLAVADGGTGVSSLSAIVGTSNEISVTDGGATIVNGDATLALADELDLSSHTSFALPTGTDPKVDASGEIAVDSDGGSGITDAMLTFYDGSTQMYVLAMDSLPGAVAASNFLYVNTGGALELDTAAGLAIMEKSTYDGDFNSKADVAEALTTGTSPTVDGTDNIAIDTNGDPGLSITQGIINFYDGTQTQYVISVDAYPTATGQVPIFDTTSNKILWGSEAANDQRYAGLAVSSNAAATAVGVANTWYQVTVFDTDLSDYGADADHTSDDITLNVSDTYMVSVSATVTGGAGDAIEFAVFRNNGGTQLTGGLTAKPTATGNNDVISLSGIAALSNTDTIELWCRNTTDTDNITVKDASMSLFRLYQ